MLDILKYYVINFCTFIPSTCNLHSPRRTNLRKVPRKLPLTLFAHMASSVLISDTQPWKDLKVTERN